MGSLFFVGLDTDSVHLVLVVLSGWCNEDGWFGWRRNLNPVGVSIEKFGLEFFEY